jgi:hypothetical protein
VRSQTDRFCDSQDGQPLSLRNKVGTAAPTFNAPKRNLEKENIRMITNEELTPDLAQVQVEIARLQAVKAEAEAELAVTEERRRKEQEQIRQTNASQNFRAAIGSTGIKFHLEEEDLQTVLKTMDYTITPSNFGDSFRVLDSNNRQIPLEKALENLALAHPNLVHSGADHLRPRNNGAFAELCRDDFSNYAAKARWIREHSLQEWEAMPQHRTTKVPATQLTAAQYSRLPLPEKSRLVSEIGEAGVAEILRRR